MKTPNYILQLDAQLKDELWRHLLRSESRCEQAAFLYCAQKTVADDVRFEVMDWERLERENFAGQCTDYLELADETRVRVIKRAHAMAACLVEIHSHPWAWPAEFSLSDRAGLEETVPHIRWRLKGRPYLALVVGLTSYDALVWAVDGLEPERLVVEVDGEYLSPTGRSLRSWHESE